jgi:hypothetical protein
MKCIQFACAAVAVCMLLAVCTSPAAASEQSAVMTTVHQFVDGFNKGDTPSGLAACASPVSIVDEFPPHEWQGKSACADWAKAYNSNAAANAITDGWVTLHSPWHVEVDGDSAYVVVPATYAYKQHGKAVTEPDSIFTIALRKIGDAWRITGWAWAKH